MGRDSSCFSLCDAPPLGILARRLGCYGRLRSSRSSPLENPDEIRRSDGGRLEKGRTGHPRRNVFGFDRAFGAVLAVRAGQAFGFRGEAGTGSPAKMFRARARGVGFAAATSANEKFWCGKWDAPRIASERLKGLAAKPHKAGSAAGSRVLPSSRPPRANGNAAMAKAGQASQGPMGGASGFRVGLPTPKGLLQSPASGRWRK